MPKKDKRNRPTSSGRKARRLAADLRAIARRAAKHIRKPYLDHADFLYDEHGLPK